LLNARYNVLTINLAAIQDNWKKLRSITSANVAGVIKANAYGLGVQAVGDALYEAGCKEFFVASLEEGEAARKFLPSDSIIYVFGDIRANEELRFVEAGLVPVLCSMAGIQRWAEFNNRFGKSAQSAIKTNTGMTRLGLDAHELTWLCKNGELVSACNPILLMSHLACAEDPAHPLNIVQLEKFKKYAEEVRTTLPHMRFSLANSSGIFLGPEWHFDLVRPGAALYGIAPQMNQPNPMKSVLGLTLPIIQIRSLQESACLGYGAEVVLPKGSRIAVAAGGYADGINRTLGHRPEGVLCGYEVQSVGRISMDVTMFDVSSVPMSDEQLLGSSIGVINDRLNVDYLGRKNKSLGYEVLTSLGDRYKREYVRGRDSGKD
jgi:alanine racemase